MKKSSIREHMKPTEIVTLVQSLLEDKKADNVVVLDLVGQGAIVDYMVIASGTSSRHVNSLADYTASELKSRGVLPHIEGVPLCDWALIDAGDVLVHLFRPEVREFYNLEKMWGTHFAKKTAVDDIAIIDSLPADHPIDVD